MTDNIARERVMQALQEDFQSPGLSAIAAERLRQIEQEGYTPEEDRRYNCPSDMIWAGIAHAAAAVSGDFAEAACIWPWRQDTFKPTNKFRDLEKAGALLAAAHDRLTDDLLYNTSIRDAVKKQEESGDRAALVELIKTAIEKRKRVAVVPPEKMQTMIGAEVILSGPSLEQLWAKLDKLEADNHRLRGALRDVKAITTCETFGSCEKSCMILDSAQRIASEALGESQGEKKPEAADV